MRGMMGQARVEKEVRGLRSPRLKAGETAERERRSAIKKEEDELWEVMDMPARLQKEVRGPNLKVKEVDEEKYEMRKDSGICMVHDVME